MPDGTATQTDAALGSGEKGTPTFTQEQVDKIVRERETAVMADVGRLKAEADKALNAAKGAAERLRHMEQEREQAELESAKDNPDKLSLIRTRQQVRQRETELALARDELNATKAALTEIQTRQTEDSREKHVETIAVRLQVDPSRLAKLAKFTDGTAEAIEAIAKELPKKTPVGPAKPDSNVTTGGGTRIPTLEEVKSVSPEEFERKIKAGDWKIR